jgi:hypothetical protein
MAEEKARKVKREKQEEALTRRETKQKIIIGSAQTD